MSKQQGNIVVGVILVILLVTFVTVGLWYLIHGWTELTWPNLTPEQVKYVTWLMFCAIYGFLFGTSSTCSKK